MRKYHIYVDNYFSDKGLLDTESLMSSFPDIKDSIVPLISYKCKDVNKLALIKNNSFFEDKEIYSDNIGLLKEFVNDVINPLYSGESSTKILQHVFLRREKDLGFLESLSPNKTENQKLFVNHCKNKMKISKFLDDVFLKVYEYKNKIHRTSRNVLNLDWSTEGSLSVENNVCNLFGQMLGKQLSYNETNVGDFGITNRYVKETTAHSRLTVFVII